MFFVLDTSLICILTISDTGAVRIANCIDGFVDLREDVANTITCDGLAETDGLTWTMERNGRPWDVATCLASSGCTNHSSVLVVGRDTHVQLLFQPPGRAEDQYTEVTCTSGSSPQDRLSASCKMNVISMLNV